LVNWHKLQFTTSYIKYIYNTQNSTICIPKQICWDDIALSNKWTLENLVLLPKIDNNVTDLDYITQAKDGTIA
jgi:hypothetical protein